MNTNVGSEEELTPSLEEVSMAVKCLNNNQSPGTDGIPAELYKHGETKLLQYIHSIVTDALLGKGTHYRLNGRKELYDPSTRREM
jgi:hypothetical protein